MVAVRVTIVKEGGEEKEEDKLESAMVTEIRVHGKLIEPLNIGRWTRTII